MKTGHLCTGAYARTKFHRKKKVVISDLEIAVLLLIASVPICYFWFRYVIVDMQIPGNSMGEWRMSIYLQGALMFLCSAWLIAVSILEYIQVGDISLFLVLYTLWYLAFPIAIIAFAGVIIVSVVENTRNISAQKTGNVLMVSALISIWYVVSFPFALSML